MMSARIIATKLMPFLRPLTQNGLLSPADASGLILDYMRTGDIRAITAPIGAIHVSDNFTPLLNHVTSSIEKEELKWKAE